MGHWVILFTIIYCCCVSKSNKADLLSTLLSVARALLRSRCVACAFQPKLQRPSYTIWLQGVAVYEQSLNKRKVLTRKRPAAFVVLEIKTINPQDLTQGKASYKRFNVFLTMIRNLFVI